MFLFRIRNDDFFLINPINLQEHKKYLIKTLPAHYFFSWNPVNDFLQIFQKNPYFWFKIIPVLNKPLITFPKMKEYYHIQIEELCRDVELNKSSAWHVFTQEIVKRAGFVKTKLINFPEKEEIFKDMVGQAMLEFCRNKAKLFAAKQNCNSIINNVVTVIRNRAIDFIRAKREQPFSEQTPQPEVYQQSEEFNLLVKETMEKYLTENERSVLQMSVMGYKNPEIAARLSLSESSVSSFLHKARTKIRPLLKEYLQ